MAQETVVEALVMRRWAVGEADKRLSLYTRERGKVYAVARGSRKAGSKMGSLTEPLSLIRVRVIQGRSNAILAQPQPINTFPYLQFDLERLTLAVTFCELLDRLVPEGEPNEELFLLACTILKSLETHPSPPTLLAWGLWRIIRLLGYEPQLEACAICKKPLKGKIVGLDAVHGGVLCAACLRGSSQAFRMPLESVETLNQWISHLSFPTESPYSLPLLYAARAYLQFFLEAELKAFDFFSLLNQSRLAE